MRYDDVDIKKIDKKIVDLIKKTNKGIFIFGETGRGKTYSLYAIKKRFKELGMKAEIENWVELLLDLREKTQWLRDEIKKIIEPEILMIDDLGSERQTEWSQEILYTIINMAYQKEKKVFIATNLSLEEFTARYGDRIFSRLMEMCEPYELKGKDRRIE
jgi:DNA replication protein DnaC